DMIYLSDYNGQGQSLSSAGWTLLRYASCPVLIIRNNVEQQRKSVLAALNTQNHAAAYRELGEKIITVSQWIADAYGAELHVVNAYEDSLHFPDRSRILRETNLPNDRVHIVHGSPEDVIADIADKIEADIVVIGTRNRRGISAMMRGNTSEKVIARVRQDIMTLN
ncbi:MAG: universal stress protein, partial [Endozoicomonas sp.]